jgi:hypothetical protein
VFSHIHQLAHDNTKERHTEDTEMNGEKLKKLQAAFTSMIAEISLPTLETKDKKSLQRVRAPDFARMDDTYPTLFLNMQSKLQAHKLHSHFEYCFLDRRDKIV